MAARPRTLPDARTLLGELVRFDTVSRNSNLTLIEFVADYLSGLGVQSEIIKDESGAKADLIATVGPADIAGLMLAGHTDVVPVDDQNWSSDPFQIFERDERLYGRGTCDMKGFIAVVLGLIAEVDLSRLKRPIHLGFTYDEETGCFGGQALARHLMNWKVRPEWCIVGEPTSMAVVNGHKGKLSVDCHVHGTDGHSAYIDKGVNAVEIGAEIVAHLRAMQSRIRSEEPGNASFDPPFTTIHTGRMEGGIARNIIPRNCRFEFEIRNLPGQDSAALLDELKMFIADTLLPEMQAVDPNCGIELEVQSDIPALAPEDRNRLFTMALQLTGTNASRCISFATEAGLYQGVGIPTIVCGPGSITQAHRADEFVTLEQIAKCETFLREIINAQHQP